MRPSMLILALSLGCEPAPAPREAEAALPEHPAPAVAPKLDEAKRRRSRPIDTRPDPTAVEVVEEIRAAPVAGKLAVLDTSVQLTLEGWSLPLLEVARRRLERRCVQDPALRELYERPPSTAENAVEKRESSWLVFAQPPGPPKEEGEEASIRAALRLDGSSATLWMLEPDDECAKGTDVSQDFRSEYFYERFADELTAECEVLAELELGGRAPFEDRGEGMPVTLRPTEVRGKWMGSGTDTLRLSVGGVELESRVRGARLKASHGLKEPPTSVAHYVQLFRCDESLLLHSELRATRLEGESATYSERTATLKRGSRGWQRIIELSREGDDAVGMDEVSLRHGKRSLSLQTKYTLTESDARCSDVTVLPPPCSAPSACGYAEVFDASTVLAWDGPEGSQERAARARSVRWDEMECD